MEDGGTVYSVSFVIVGEELDPDEISRELDLTPSQSWRKRDPRTQTDGSPHEYGGWKLWLEDVEEKQALEAQIELWLSRLMEKGEALSKIQDMGFPCILDCYIGANGSDFVHLDSGLIRRAGSIGVDIDFNFYG